MKFKKIILSVHLFEIRAFGLIPAKHIPKLGEIMKIICDNGFSISNCAMYDLNVQQSNELTKTLGFGISDIWSSGNCVALVITGSDAFNRLSHLVAGIFFTFHFKLRKNNKITNWKFNNNIFIVSVQGPERQTNQKYAGNLVYGNGALTDALFCPNSDDDVLKVN